MKHLFPLLLLVFSYFSVNASESYSKVEGLKAFAKLYGYVKYFHPSEEASKVDWEKFSIYGAEKVESCNSDTELLASLQELFHPIAPSIKIYFKENEVAYDISQISPKGEEKFKELTYWQHEGLGLGMKYSNSLYKSVRVHKKSQMIFKGEPTFGELIQKPLTNTISCQIPLVLYKNKVATYPRASDAENTNLNQSLARINTVGCSLGLRLGNIVNTYNVFQHFYPYFDETGTDWDLALEEALQYSFNSPDIMEIHIKNLERFTAKLKDGHINVYQSETEKYFPAFAWEWIEEKLIITQVFDENIPLTVGDEVMMVDGKPALFYFEKIEERISAATNGWQKYKSSWKSLEGSRGTELKLLLEEREVRVTRNINTDIYFDSFIENEKYKTIEDGIIYLNLDKITWSEIKAKMDELNESKAIICDLRGYPKGSHFLINYLLPQKDTSRQWMQVPKIIYPDQENIVGYTKHAWNLSYIRNSKLSDKKIIFITDGRAISYAESYMSFIEHYDLATIVGQPTAGTNGDINPFNLAGDISVSWTGLKVFKHDGSQHHGVGIQPDIWVEKTVDGVKEGRDEFLEVAIKEAKKVLH
ncbi:S41 family peptidase [Sediminitomix flava]|uniref:C-terminal processing protease CtpA/Prc n=1 Tax=Sediminitomix flava TaxID=379075 RepID=A0A315ZDS4_SEDFL|nr:S41 family peptidase [Sediminitomix flava]PWJ42904.1 C-terminal processing protease CtpA/Prc [Sediminitomix flava]